MSTQHKQVVVIGAGYAGLLAATRLVRKVRNQPVSITLVNAADVFVERLRLHQLAANQPVRQRPIADVLHGTNVTFVRGTVSRLDPAQREVVVETETGARRLSYDYLIYALGSLTDRDRVPGVRDHAYTLAPSGALSAPALREVLPAVNRAGGQLVVCGGGATGVECAAEFAESYPNLRVKLVTRGEFGQSFNEPVAAHMRRALTRLGVTIQDGTTVTAVKSNELETAGGPIPFDVCLWAGGFSVPILARESGLAVNERGQILIDPYMRSISHPAILAVGDAAYPPEEHGVKVMQAVSTGELDGLMQLLSDDMTLWADGGGKIRGAAIHPLHGREVVARFVLASTRFVSGDYHVEIADINGEPAVILRMEEQARVVLFITVERGRLQEIRAIGNPDKLKHV